MKNGRKLASKVLGLAIFSFIIMLVLHKLFPEFFIVRLFLFVSEAALVGGIADWFAVTALFKKPFPIPVPQPHTGLIPKNREKVIASIAQVVENELLTKEMIGKKTAGINYFELFIQGVESNNQHTDLAVFITGFIKKALTNLDPYETAKKLDSFIKKNSFKLDLALPLQKFVLWAIENREDDKWLELALEELSIKIKQPKTRDNIYNLLNDIKDQETKGIIKGFFYKIAKKIDGINLSDLADSFHQEMCDSVDEIKDNPGHILRIKLKALVVETADGLGKNEKWKKSINSWKEGVVERLDLVPFLEELITAAVGIVTKPTKEIKDGFFHKTINILNLEEKVVLDDESLLVKWALVQLQKYWAYLKRNKVLSEWVNRYTSELLGHVVETEHALIGKMVSDTLNGFTNEMLIDFIDDKFGNDLQWIRINGCQLGAIIGLLLFLLQELVYSPLLG
ncbi:MAG: hypothetical protein CVU87_12600 [Firmicutes bacterium HGW-Firmicutes-12]|jgi:uncharacterized membrane-anchored protein YjiN (DUF445 family)|nr:MAG: hypothetical protein CVU87_12600 [Firmicutes bacterium HGW-Firmicutes-12]